MHGSAVVARQNKPASAGRAALRTPEKLLLSSGYNPMVSLYDWLVHFFSPKEIRRRPLQPGIARLHGEKAIHGGHYDTESPASTGRTLLMEAITT
ncbi:unnamed protein product [Sphagnum jensenii]